MVLKIITVPNPILRKKAAQVKVVNGKIRQLAQQMRSFLKNDKDENPKGIGLAAPQIGQSLKIIVIWSQPSHKYLTLINPEIVWKSKRTRLGVPGRKNPFEGCLSVPDVWGKVRRHSVIKVLYQTLDGQPVIKKFRGFTGVIIQHETDHLDGVLFIDRILQQKGKLFKIGKDENDQNHLIEVKIP